jgi:hypothetical protein
MTAREGSSDSSESKQPVDMPLRQDGVKSQQPQSYMTKKVVLGGQTVTLYSVNGITWLSSPDQLPETMARLENARILLTDPKAAEAAAAAAPKATTARYRMKGPKPRPILQPDGTLLPPTERLIPPATETQVKVEAGKVELVEDSPAARIKKLRAGTLEGTLAQRDTGSAGERVKSKDQQKRSKDNKVISLETRKAAHKRVTGEQAARAAAGKKVPHSTRTAGGKERKVVASATKAVKPPVSSKPVALKSITKKEAAKSDKATRSKATTKKSAANKIVKKTGKRR